MQWLRRRGVRIDPVRDGAVRGERVSAASSDRGTLLYFHGGGYVACSPATHRPITAGLARRTRRRVFSADYRLAPEHRFPAALDDAVAIYRWLLERNVRPETLSLAGDSAGGGLVVATLLRARDEGLPLPAAAVCFSPWTDLTGSGASVHANDGRCATFRPDNFPAFARIYLGTASPMHPYASPLFADLRGLPPLLIQVSSSELLLDDSRRLHDRVIAAGGRSTLDVFDDLVHAWQMGDGLVPEARIALERVAAFLDNPA
jgi:acetyl esterase/lipase